MTEPDDAPFEALVALAVELQLAWEAAEAQAEAARQDRARVWTAARAAGANQGGNVMSRLWRAVAQARITRLDALPARDAFDALVDGAATAYLAVEDAKAREHLANGQLSTAWEAALKAMPPGMSRGELQRRYEAARERIRADRAS
jgi:hypothetical protein